MKHVIVCDIDGTVSDPTHRLHHVRGARRKDWPAFFDACGEDACHDDVVKEEILERDLRLAPADVLCVLDDRDRVVAMWRRRGLRVLQVADGDF